MAIKLIYRLIALLLIAILSNLVYKTYFFEADLKKHADFIDSLRSINPNCKVLYLGESSNITARIEDDSDKRAISDFLALFYPTISFDALTKPAAHAGIYLRYLQNLPKESEIETVIVTLNLRSFNAGWIYSDLETSLQKSITLLKPNPPIVNRFLLSFKAYDIKTPKEREQQFKRSWSNDHFVTSANLPYKNVIEWDKYMNHKGYANSDGSKNWELTTLSCHYIKTFAFQINEQNPRVQDFDKIVKLAKKRGWNLVFNVLPENTQKAEQMVGPELVRFIRQNLDFIKTRYNAMGVLVVDNLELVDDREFIDQNWTTEHYAQIGRQQIATNLAVALKQFYPNNFLSVDFKPHTPMTFFTDCEATGRWEQWQTIVNEKAYSGQYSSKVYDKQPYGLTHTLPVRIMAQDYLNFVDVECMVYLDAPNNEANLVFQTQGFENPLQNSIKINNLIKPMRGWQKINYSFKIHEQIYKAQTLKVFVHNPDTTPIYIDDIKIKYRF